MGVMNELQGQAVIEADAANQPVTKEVVVDLFKKGAGAHTEIDVKTDLSFVKLYAEIYEDGKPTNRIVNVNKPWEVRVYFGIEGPLQEMLCGKWCVDASFESTGPGPEFRIKHPHFYFDCHQNYWCVSLPGKMSPDYCGDPYEVTVSVRAISKCGKPLAIIGFVELPEVLFYAG